MRVGRATAHKARVASISRERQGAKAGGSHSAYPRPGQYTPGAQAQSACADEAGQQVVDGPQGQTWQAGRQAWQAVLPVLILLPLCNPAQAWHRHLGQSLDTRSAANYNRFQPSAEAHVQDKANAMASVMARGREASVGTLS
jgi:hypothetical protein